MKPIIMNRSPLLFGFLIALCVSTLAVPPVVAKPAPEKSQASESKSDKSKTEKPPLGELLKPVLKRHRGKVAVAVKDLASGETFQMNADEPMPTASLIKLPIMVTAYQAAQENKVSLDQMITIKAEDKTPGSGLLSTHFSPGTQLSLRDAIQLMIAYSDNLATNLVIDQIGLPATTKQMQELGYKETQLHAKVFRRDTSINLARSRKYGLGSTTANEMIALIERLHAGELVDSASCEAMMEHLYACEDRSKIPRYLPEETRVAHKTGAVSSSRCDAGVIDAPNGPILYCFLTTDNVDRQWSDENEANMLGAEFGRIVFNYYNDPEELAAAPVARILRVGADGELVEALQRTINARLKAKNKEETFELSTDGDFGPNTAEGVRRFQKQVDLPVTGEVDAKTWQALGALVEKDAPVAPPQEVNTRPLEKEPTDSLTGPPVTTCKAYFIANGKTGERLWGMEDTTVRDPASTTKMMTAYLVTSLAEAHPEVLEEIVTFSERADETSGSTSGVRKGEQLPVKELLYGLMLPSGNDASVAIAETFGPRVAEGGLQEDEKPYDAFIRAMNEKAKELGMQSTGYRNPHGLTAKGHVTTAADLGKLAHAVMKQPLYREIVSTRQHGCTLDSVDGYQRNVVWRNTNRLLKQAPYTGIKTGTTGPAGACLVSTGQRGDHPLIVVILGATSGDARYVDARNLYRWAWQQLGVEEKSEEKSEEKPSGA